MLKICLQAPIALTICLFSMALKAADSDVGARPGYSFFGLGPNFVSYEENTTLQIDDSVVDVETETTINTTQQSGTYVSFSKDWGFYLTTSSTLGESSSEERWLVGETTIRSNRVSFEQQHIGFVLSRRYKSNYSVLFGAQYDNTEFKRFAHQPTPAASEFVQDENFSDPGTESETVLELSFVAGLEKTTIFQTTQPGWRYRTRVLFGSPVLTRISNTEVNDGKSFSEEFNGLVLHARATYGYQINANLFAGINIDLAVSKRNAIDRGVADSAGITRFPKNTLIYLFPSLSLYWSF